MSEVFLTPHPAEKTEDATIAGSEIQMDEDDEGFQMIDRQGRQMLTKSHLSYEPGKLFNAAQEKLLESYKRVANIISNRGSPSTEHHILGIRDHISNASRCKQLIDLHKNGGQKAFKTAFNTLTKEKEENFEFLKKRKDTAFKATFRKMLMVPHQDKIDSLLFHAKSCKELIEDLDNLRKSSGGAVD